VGHVQHVLHAAQLLPAAIVNFETADWEQALTHKRAKHAANSNSSQQEEEPEPEPEAPVPAPEDAPGGGGGEGEEGGGDGGGEAHLQGSEHAAPHRRNDDQDLETARENQNNAICVHIPCAYVCM
jgi:hypothetical protein